MAAAAAPAAESTPPAHPFAGLLVLDFAGWLAAPFGTSLIADLGARVIKVESLAGDEYRGRGQARGRTFQGKESLCIDLKNAEGRALMHRLIARADGLMHNMRGDAAERLGIDYATVRGLNPEIVYLYAGSYGSTGPGAGRAAFHPTAGALAGGALWQLGRGNEPPPADEPLTIAEIDDWSLRLFRANEGSPDVSAALGVGTALALALYHKERTGEGQYLETSMLISNAYVASDDFLRYAGKPPRREADRYLRGLHALCRLYRTAAGWLFLDCQTEGEWRALGRALERADLLDDPRFRDVESRLVHDAALVAALAQAFAARRASDWETALPAAGVPAVAADGAGGDFFLTDPSLLAEQLTVKTEHPTLGAFYRPGPPALFSRTPARAEPAHALGEDTGAILTELGLAAGEIARLEQAGVIRTAG
jgi:crotonobetainyl-CoA:carnitine CoA-transferase CaiB-like acyl-CoA transferase